jgi:hypothetical protein
LEDGRTSAYHVDIFVSIGLRSRECLVKFLEISRLVSTELRCREVTFAQLPLETFDLKPLKE